MASVRELLDAGQLSRAIDAATAEVREAPTDSRRRIMLFELLGFAGDWERALKQLDAIGHQYAAMELGVAIYRSCVAAERERARVFAGKERPRFPEEVPADVALRADALALRGTAPEQALALLEKAEEDRPALAARADGKDVADFRDYDDFLAPVLEVFWQDRYFWVPLAQVAEVEFFEAKKLRDLLWLPTRVKLASGKTAEGFVPTLYPGSATHADEAVRLGHATETVDLGSGLAATVGRRCFLSGDGAVGLLSLRHLLTGPPAPPA